MAPELKYHHPRTVEDDDNLLLDRFHKGDEAVFTVLYDRYCDAMLSYGRGLGFDHERIRDVIQDIFFRLYTDSIRAREVRHLKPYLFRALKNRLLNNTIAASRNVSIDAGGREFSISVTVMDEMIREEEREILQQRIEIYLNRLTARQREAVYLRFMQGFEYEEIAALLNITPHAATKLVSRAINGIRDKNLLVLLVSSQIIFNKI